MIFVDANVFLSAFVEPQTQNDVFFYEAATTFLEEADSGGVDFTTSDAVLAEVAFILTSKKHHDKSVSVAAAALPPSSKHADFVTEISARCCAR